MSSRQFLVNVLENEFARTAMFFPRRVVFVALTP
jgi:hypothetical protein